MTREETREILKILIYVYPEYYDSYVLRDDSAILNIYHVTFCFKSFKDVKKALIDCIYKDISNPFPPTDLEIDMQLRANTTFELTIREIWFLIKRYFRNKKCDIQLKQKREEFLKIIIEGN